MAVHELAWSQLGSIEIVLPAFLSTALLWGSYPMTQVYQHEEDGRRGDLTLSRMLGIRGTFLFTALVFLLATLGFVYYFYSYHHWMWALGFILFLLPVLGYFFWWMYKVWQDASFANYQHTMRLNLLSSLCLNLFFLALLGFN
jgi:1,4-dihydroxy-2-naphthoate octaprenyltransferase